MNLSQFMNTRELFRQFENSNHYYTEQILLSESFLNQSQYLHDISSLEDVHNVQLNQKIYSASIVYYKKMKNKKIELFFIKLLCFWEYHLYLM
jgi:hypothetical protein